MFNSHLILPPYRADYETRIRVQKTTKLKQVDNRIITLKREISKLKDILAEYGTYQGFLSDLSPQSWRDKQKETQVELEQFSFPCTSLLLLDFI